MEKMDDGWKRKRMKIEIIRYRKSTVKSDVPLISNIQDLKTDSKD
jgi:uncharacterized protein YdaU (DUF1376 family)